MKMEEMEKMLAEEGDSFHAMLREHGQSIFRDKNRAAYVVDDHKWMLHKCKSFLLNNKHFYRNAVLKDLKDTYCGIADKKKLVNNLRERIMRTVFNRFNLDDESAGILDRVFKINLDADEFVRAYCREIVNWLGQNVCLDVFDLVVTKQAYKRIDRFYFATSCGKDMVKIWPKQWNETEAEHE